MSAKAAASGPLMRMESHAAARSTRDETSASRMLLEPTVTPSEKERARAEDDSTRAREAEVCAYWPMVKRRPFVKPKLFGAAKPVSRDHHCAQTVAPGTSAGSTPLMM